MRALTAFVLAPIPGAIFFVAMMALLDFIEGANSPAGYEPIATRTLIFSGFGSVIYAYWMIGFVAFPIFLFLRSKNVETALLTIVIAALLAFPAASLMVFDKLSTTDWGTKNPFPFGPCAGYTGGSFMICTFVELLIVIAVFAASGAIAGATFWLIYKKKDRHKCRRAITD